MSHLATVPKDGGDLTVTALYTAEAWRWGGFAGAELLATPQARWVFRITNAVLGLARMLRPRLPSLRHSLAQRHAVLDSLCAEHLRRSAGPSQVLELAAGLTPRGIAFSEDPGSTYVEVDLPAMIAKKRELLDRTEEGRAVASRENLRLVAGDVTTLTLGDLVEPPPAPLLVLAEGLLMYLGPERQLALWRRVAGLLAERPGSTFAFDLVPFCEQPRPGLIGRALEWCFKRFSRGRTMAQDARTRADLLAELEEAGFSSVRALEPAELRAGDALPYPGKRTQVLVFICRF